ncbi:NO-inducible flavohemoprotein [Phyllobacterium sp. YR531]|uniref:NO-inducible flavohemoprotein n=1 Tax=Phyllobacterium sp. YR531 TaxID=1144343 RepID=UPI00026FA966|nr:NO-inducible flavohemoprotein [Phyllobacterium sp. YR531]EJN05975.1 hemoglobin-like flavoprotein [Phyllobacterium sp. YR531]
MQKTLRAETIALVKASVPALVAHGPAITSNMYSRLLQDPHIRALFNQANQKSGSQVQALAGAILGYAQNIDNLEALVPVVERIAQKHIGYNILPEHYPYVATALIGAIAEVLGDAATEEILSAWGEAYWFLADILKGREKVIREEIAHTDGGWSGWRPFVVSEKIRESEVITSLILRPVDGQAVLRHRPGQYLTFRFDAPDQVDLKRNYSISCAPNGEYYRISVKREPNGQGGSRFLHDYAEIGTVLETTPPSGDFFLSDAPKRPIILLSGGVGLTPMVSMMETIADHHSELEIHYVHGTMNSTTHAMNDHVHALARQHGRISVTTFYSDPCEGDVLGKTHDFTGFVTIPWLKENTPFDQADFYLCGPKPFLEVFVGGLSRAGIAPDRIHYEFFGPTATLIAA